MSSTRISWLALLALGGMALLLPDPSPGDGARFALLGGYPAQVVDNLYRLIRVAMPWLPTGVLLALVLPPLFIRRLAVFAVLAGMALVLVLGPDGGRLALARDLLFVFPGLATGLWLAERSRFGARFAAPGPAGATVSEPLADAAPAVSTAAKTAVVPGQPGVPVPQAARQAPGLRPARAVAGGVLVAAAVLLALTLPRWGLPLALGLAVCAALIWWRPLAALVLVPAALPLLDLAPWTGRILLDEFDLLMAASAGVLLLRRPLAAPAPLRRGGALLIGLFLASAAVSAGIGLFPLPPLDANAFASDWSPLNAWRVGKGIVCGLVFFWMLRRVVADEAGRTRALALGMALGLFGVAVVGVWERWLFAGLGDEASTYRIVSTFSSMHTGGGHIEAYLVAALPFLWLGLFRWRSALLAVPVLVLSAYVMLYTVARGGVLAFVVIALVLAVATLHEARGLAAKAAFRRAVVPMSVLLGSAVLVLAGSGSGYLMQRFERSAQDWDTRVSHWSLALQMMDSAGPSWLFGKGIGSFARTYLWQGPADRQPATFSFANEAGRDFLRLGTGETLYVAQRVSVAGGSNYRLSLEARSREAAAKLVAPLCEKQLLNSRRCDWNEFEVPGDGQWHRLTHDFAPAQVGEGPAWRHLPVELYFHNPGRSGVVDVGRVSLLDPQGREMMGNGDFAQGSDFWFFKTQSHLPWHIKNFWVHTCFESGAVGLLLTVALAALALSRLARAGWRGNRLAWAVLASLAGLLTVGLFDSLVDAPRLATLLFAWLFLGAAGLGAAPRRSRGGV